MSDASNPKTVERMLAFIGDLCDLPTRLAGSEGERMAQARVAGVLSELGFKTAIEGAACPAPQHWVLALHAGLLLVFTAWALLDPSVALAGFGLGVFSFWGELRGGPFVFRRLLPKRLSSSLVGRQPRPGAAGRVLLVAHADVAPSSALFRPWLKRLILRREKPGRGIHPGTIVLIAGTVQALCSLMLWMGTGNSARLLSVLVVSASVHLGLLLLALDWARSEPGPGAIDNASGLAVAAAAAAALQEKPLSNTEVWVVATGAREPDGGGMRAFLHQFGASLPRENTYIINVDDVGRGRLHYAVSEGRWNRIAYRPSLPAAAERVASRPPFLEVGEVALVGTTDAGQATRSGYRAVTLCSLEKGRRPVVLHNPEDRLDAVQGTSLAEALEFTLALVREVDELLAWEENRKTRRDRAESDTAVGAEPSAS